MAILILGSGLFLDAAPPPDPDLTRRAAIGLALFVLGLIVLAAVVATGFITPAAPIVGGAVATLFGLIGMIAAYVESALTRGLDALGLSDTAQAYVTNWLVTGAVLTIGVLMLIAGLVLGGTRRRAAAAVVPPAGRPPAGPPHQFGPPPGGAAPPGGPADR